MSEFDQIPKEVMYPVQRQKIAPTGLPENYKYWAFISYSHQDRQWGKWLHKKLESYSIPRFLVGHGVFGREFPKRLAPIFRDIEELPTSSDLGPMIEDALRHSLNLIVICSPRSAASRWVNAEVLTFKKLGRTSRIHCLIVDGEPSMSDKPGLGGQECFCDALRYAVDSQGVLTSMRTEPLAADVRLGRQSKTEAILKLVAGIVGIGFDELRRREYHRKYRRLIAIATACVCFVFFTLSLSIFAIRERNEAQRQQGAAEDNWKKSVVGGLPFLANSISGENLVTGLLLGVQALNFETSPDAVDTLYKILDDGKYLHFTIPDRVETGMDKHWHKSGTCEFSPSGAILAIMSVNKGVGPSRTAGECTVRFWDVKKGTRIGVAVHLKPCQVGCEKGKKPLPDFGVTDDGYLAVRSRDHSHGNDQGIVHWDLWNIHTGKHSNAQGTGAFDPRSIIGPVGFPCAVSHDRKSIACAEQNRNEDMDYRISIRELGTNQLRDVIGNKRHGISLVPFFATLIFGPDDRFLYIFWEDVPGSSGINDAELARYNLTGPSDLKRKKSIKGDTVADLIPAGSGAAAFEPGSRILAIGGWDGALHLQHIKDFSPVTTPLRAHSEPLALAQFSPGGRYLQTIDTGGHSIIWDSNPANPILEMELKFKSAVRGLSLYNNPRLLAVLLGNHVEVWDIQKRRKLGDIDFPKLNPATLAFSPVMPVLAVGGPGFVQLWDVEDGKLKLHSKLDVGGDYITFDPSGHTLAVGSVAAGLTVIDLKSGVVKFQDPKLFLPSWGGDPVCLALSKSGNRIAFRKEGRVFLLDGNKAGKWEQLPNRGWTRSEGTRDCLSFSPDGRRLAYGSMNLLYVYDLQRGRLAGEELKGHQFDITAVAYDPRGRFLVSASKDEVVFRDASSMLPYRYLHLPGLRVSSKDESELQIYMKRFNSFYYHGVEPNWASEAHMRAWPSLRFSPDGKLLAYATDANTVTVWDTDIESWKRKACMKAGRNLSSSEWRKFIGDAFSYQRTCPQYAIPYEH